MALTLVLVGCCLPLALCSQMHWETPALVLGQEGAGLWTTPGWVIIGGVAEFYRDGTQRSVRTSEVWWVADVAGWVVGCPSSVRLKSLTSCFDGPANGRWDASGCGIQGLAVSGSLSLVERCGLLVELAGLATHGAREEASGGRNLGQLVGLQ